MEIKLQTFREAKKNDILRHNGKAFVPISLDVVLSVLKDEIVLLNSRIDTLEKENKEKLKQIVDLVKQINEGR